MDPDLERAAQRLGRTVADGAAVVVGLGVLGLNRAQALRRRLVEQMDAARDERPAASGTPGDVGGSSPGTTAHDDGSTPEA